MRYGKNGSYVFRCHDPEQMKEKGEECLRKWAGKSWEREVTGYECVVAEVSGVRTWVYEEHITLKSAMSLGTMEQKEEATLFEVNPSIPSSQFTPWKHRVRGYRFEFHGNASWGEHAAARLIMVKKAAPRQRGIWSINQTGGLGNED